MRRAALLCATLLVAACGDAEDGDMTEDTTDMTMAPAALTAADLVGTWDLEVRTMTSDSVILNGTMAMAAGSAVATQMIGDGEAQTVNLTFDGDSVMTSIDPYPSNLREGVMVATTGVYRLVNGRVEGITTARYQGDTTADSVVQFRGTWTRRP